MNSLPPMSPMNQPPYAAPPPLFPQLPPLPPLSSAFWDAANVRNRFEELHKTLDFAKAMEKELEVLMMVKDGKASVEGAESGGNEDAASKFVKFLEDNRIDLASQEAISLQAANAIISKLTVELEPFKAVTDDTIPWEEKSAAVRLSNKIQKHKRNKLWRKRKRRRVAEMLAKERELFDKADQEADEWRAREIAKEIAKRKVEKMKEIAKVKANEGRKRLESELELVLIVEKLQELRSIRIQKLTKQGHFLPEEDNKFLERVRAAVEEEERQAMASADKEAAMDAIAIAEESRKNKNTQGSKSEDSTNDRDALEHTENQTIETNINGGSSAENNNISGKQVTEVPGSVRGYDTLANLPLEFYHYYHGSNTDMGTLIEVRRTWDAYIRPGGSRIPGHWVQPPPPANEIWASYLVKPE